MTTDNRYEYDRCPRCLEYDFVRTHTCPPKWQVQMPEFDGVGTAYETEPRDVYAASASAAAERALELNFDAYEYPEQAEVWVRKTEDDPWEKFIVHVEAVPQFTAEKKSEADE